MKKELVLLILISLLLPLVLLPSVAAVSQINTQEIQTTLLSQTPDPVEPGQILKVKFKIENNGAETSQDAVVKILPKYPFSIYNDVAEKNVGKLRAASTGADAPVVEFRLKVAEDAVEGDAELELEIQLGQASIVYVDDEFLIDIQTHDAILDITSISSDPTQIAPGETAEISIMVKNLADSLLKDIKFKLGFGDDIPLAPYQSSSERRISQLGTNFQNSMAFKIIADPEAAPGLYKVPLNITYNDEKGNSYHVEDILAVTVGESPKIKAYIKKSTVLQKNKEGKLTLEIANAGTSDIKFLELYLLPSDDYQLITTTDYFYLGDVDSDDTESEEIDIFVKWWGVKDLQVPIMLKYHDANNKPFQQQFNLKLSLYSTYKLKKFGILAKSNAWAYLFVIIILIIGFFNYRKYKKNPEEFLKKTDTLKIKSLKYFKKIINKVRRWIPFIKQKRK